MATIVNVIGIPVILYLICGLAFCLALPKGLMAGDTSGKSHQLFLQGITKQPDFPECIVENYECSDMSSMNFIQEFYDVHTNEGCKQRCVENIDCGW